MKIYLFLFSMIFAYRSAAQEMLLLYPHEIPNSKNPESDRYKMNIPEIHIYKPASIVKSKLILVLPGGGYGGLAMKHEGHDVGKALADVGYTAVVLKYRLPSDDIMIDKRIGPVQDAQNAIKYLRENKIGLNIQFEEIGVLGFSAGGHLASTVATHFDQKYIYNPEKTSLRPDFSILLYPVISFEKEVTHEGSKQNLIGPLASDDDTRRFSNNLQVTSDTPPAYLMHARDDDAVPIKNSELYVDALDKFGIENRFFIYEKGGHGFGMINPKEKEDWFADLIKWLEK